MTMRIQVRFCGGCNPDIERGAVVRQIMAILGQKAQWTFDALPRDPVDLILNISGCAHACLDEEARPSKPDIPVISIQGRQVDRNPVTEQDLAGCAAKKIIDLEKQ